MEPLYGDTYLPRKFKSRLAIKGDNCIDVYSQDVGIVAHEQHGRLAGFTVLVGGGMGMTHGNAAAHRRVADQICFVEPDAPLGTFLTIIEIKRDRGNRASPKLARPKYLVDDSGVDAFRAEMERLACQLAPPRPLLWQGNPDHLAWNQQHDGRWFLGLCIENDRIADRDEMRRRTAFRELVARFRPEVRLTAQQNILQCRVERALCALFRCQREWDAPELIARLAVAPSGADRPDARTPAAVRGTPARLGQSAAARAVQRCVAQGLLVVCLSDSPGPPHATARRWADAADRKRYDGTTMPSGAYWRPAARPVGRTVRHAADHRAAPDRRDRRAAHRGCRLGRGRGRPHRLRRASRRRADTAV